MCCRNHIAKMALPFWLKLGYLYLGKIWTHPPLPMALVIPPTEIPDANKADVDKLHQSVRTLLTHKAIPWQVQAKLARDGYVTMEDLADRWDTPENARNHSPQELEFQRNAHITEAQEKFVAMRIYQCVRHAKSVVLNQPSASTGPLSRPKSTLAGALDSLCDRKQLLKNWDDLVNCPDSLRRSRWLLFLEECNAFHLQDLAYVHLGGWQQTTTQGVQRRYASGWTLRHLL